MRASRSWCALCAQNTFFHLKICFFFKLNNTFFESDRLAALLLAMRPKLLTSPLGTFQIDPTHSLTGHEAQTSDQPTRHCSDWPHPQPYWPRGPNFWPAHQALFRLTPPTTLLATRPKSSDQPTRHCSDWPHPQPYWPRGPNFWPVHRALPDWPMCPDLKREWNSAKHHGHTFMFKKLSHKSLARTFTRNGMGRGYLVVVTVSTWQLWDL